MESTLNFISDNNDKFNKIFRQKKGNYVDHFGIIILRPYDGSCELQYDDHCGHTANMLLDVLNQGDNPIIVYHYMIYYNNKIKWRLEPRGGCHQFIIICDGNNEILCDSYDEFYRLKYQKINRKKFNAELYQTYYNQTRIKIFFDKYFNGKGFCFNGLKIRKFNLKWNNNSIYRYIL